MFTFTIDDHLEIPGARVIRIFRDGELMGSIYPTPRGIKVVSKYITDAEGSVEIERKLPRSDIPAILIHIIGEI